MVDVPPEAVAEVELRRAMAQYDEYLELTQYGRVLPGEWPGNEETWVHSPDLPLSLVISPRR